jgi:hypothetical protein
VVSSDNKRCACRDHREQRNTHLTCQVHANTAASALPVYLVLANQSISLQPRPAQHMCSHGKLLYDSISS